MVVANLYEQATWGPFSRGLNLGIATYARKLATSLYPYPPVMPRKPCIVKSQNTMSKLCMRNF